MFKFYYILGKNFEVRIPQIVRIFGFDIRNKYETQLPLLPLVVSATYPQLNMIWWPLSMICPPSTSIAAAAANLCSCTTLSQGSCTAVCLISKSFFIVCIVCPTLQLHLSPNLCPNLCSPPILISFSNYNFVFVLIRIDVRIFAVLLSESLSYDNCPDAPLFAVYLL